jgi:hypothetical protein
MSKSSGRNAQDLRRQLPRMFEDEVIETLAPLVAAVPLSGEWTTG